MKRKSVKTIRKQSSTTTHRNLPASVGLVLDTRNELKADIAALDYKMESKFQKLDSKFSSIDSKFSGMESRLKSMESSLYRIEALVEEQRSENRIVLEGLSLLNQRMERMENRQESFETTLRSFARQRETRA